jgi:hypothetical protein
MWPVTVSPFSFFIVCRACTCETTSISHTRRRASRSAPPTLARIRPRSPQIWPPAYLLVAGGGRLGGDWRGGCRRVERHGFRPRRRLHGLGSERPEVSARRWKRGGGCCWLLSLAAAFCGVVRLVRAFDRSGRGCSRGAFDSLMTRCLLKKAADGVGRLSAPFVLPFFLSETINATAKYSVVVSGSGGSVTGADKIGGGETGT